MNNKEIHSGCGLTHRLRSCVMVGDNVRTSVNHINIMYRCVHVYHIRLSTTHCDTFISCALEIFLLTYLLTFTDRHKLL